MNLRGDIYYRSEYFSLYMKENDSLFEFDFKEGSSFLYNIAIKRPITKIGQQKIIDGYYDLETPYGYGGLLTNSNNTEFISRAMTAYRNRCKNENIISEFFRFHPFNDFPEKHSEFFEFKFHERDVVYTKGVSYEQVYSSYHKNLKRDLKSIKKHDLKIKHVTTNKLFYKKIVHKLYFMTMNKNKAAEFYYFDDTYFENLLKMKDCMLFLVYYGEEIITAVLMLNGTNYLYYHISATNPCYYKLNSNRFALNEVIKIACTMNKSVYLGGGLTGCDDDPLYSFKKRFSDCTMPFFIAGRIYNKEVYDRYVEIFDKQNDENIRYFLKYRL